MRMVLAAPSAVSWLPICRAPRMGIGAKVLAVAARHRGIAGLVINGGVRDEQRILATVREGQSTVDLYGLPARP